MSPPPPRTCGGSCRASVRPQPSACHHAMPEHLRRQEDTMLGKIYAISSIIIDILILLLKGFVITLEAIFNFFFPAPPKSVEGEVTLITGAGHGIGQQLAIQYANLGAIVVCLDINEKGNEETTKLIKENGISRVFAYKCDVTKRDEVLATIKKIQTEVGEITILINNAGIMPCHSFLSHKPEEITKMFEVNILAHFWLLEAILPYMIKKNHGHVVALSSMAGVVGLKNLVPYCATKFAVRGMMEALIEEFREEKIADNVHFTMIFPYMVNTGLCKNPKINARFGEILSLLSPKLVAEHIVDAQRKNKAAITIPSFFMFINDILRLFPIKFGQLVKDFFDSGLESDLKIQ